MTAPTIDPPLRRLAQAGGLYGTRLVRVTAHDAANRYAACPVRFDADGATEPDGGETLTVTNLAEPPGSGGALPEGTEAVAADVEGRWVVFARPAASVLFPARVTMARGSAAYYVVEQVPAGPGAFADRDGAPVLTAWNLAEISLGNGSAVDPGTIVFVVAVEDDGAPPGIHHVFSHPIHAKYLD